MSRLQQFRMAIGGKANPYTGQPWALTPDGGPEDVDDFPSGPPSQKSPRPGSAA